MLLLPCMATTDSFNVDSIPNISFCQIHNVGTLSRQKNRNESEPLS